MNKKQSLLLGPWSLVVAEVSAADYGPGTKD